MDLRTFVGVVLRGWWLILLSVITTAGSAAYVVSGQQAVYRARALIEMRANNSLDPGPYISAVNALDKRTVINTQARKASGSAMMEQVAKELNIPVGYVAGSEPSAVLVSESNLIEIRAMSTEPKLAAAISNKVAEELKRQLADKVFEIVIVDQAVPPTVPVEPQPTRTITLGVLFGLALGVVFALLGYMLQVMRSSNVKNWAKDELPHESVDGVDLQGSPAKTRQLFTQ